jgi:hypothetical protein
MLNTTLPANQTPEQQLASSLCEMLVKLKEIHRWSHQGPGEVIQALQEQQHGVISRWKSTQDAIFEINTRLLRLTILSFANVVLLGAVLLSHWL